MSDINTEKSEASEEIKREGSYALLDKKTIRLSWFDWFMFYQSSYNYERMQGTGFLHSMVPIARKLYKKDPEKLKDMLRRHMTFYNCNPQIGSAVNGLTAAMEEQKAAGKDIAEEAITSIKTGLMGPLSGIGDSVFQGVIIPLMLAFTIDLSLKGSVAPAVIYMLLTIAIMIVVSYVFYFLGYEKGSNAILSILENGAINKLIAGANILGCMVIGALVASNVNVNCAIQIAQANGEMFSLQEQLFDVILPKVLPLFMTLGSYKLLKKGWSSVKILLLIVVIGTVGGLTGILG